jgi:hypothetical protein
MIGGSRLPQAQLLLRRDGEQQLVVLAAGQDQVALGKPPAPAFAPETRGAAVTVTAPTPMRAIARG